MALVATGCAGDSGSAGDESQGRLPLEIVEAGQPIGSLDGSPEETFGLITQLATGPDDELYVVDGLGRTVRVFDREGGYLRSLGREGSGPGEFRAPNFVIAGPDGTVSVRDLELERLVVFDRRGDPVATWPAPNQQAYWDPLRTDSAGRVYIGVRSWGDSVSPHHVIRFDPIVGPESADTIPIPRTVLDGITGPNGFLAEQPFATHPSWDVTPDGAVWFAEGEEAHIERRDGRTVGTIALVPLRFPISSEVADSARTATEEAIRGRLRPGFDGSDAVGAIQVPTHHPEILGLLVDRRSRLWVRRPTLDEGVSAVFDVLTPTGDLLARVGLATPGDRRLDMRWIALGRETIYVASLDALDVPRVERYPVPEALR